MKTQIPSESNTIPTQASSQTPFVWETPRLLRLDDGGASVEGKSFVFAAEFHSGPSSNSAPS